MIEKAASFKLIAYNLVDPNTVNLPKPDTTGDQIQNLLSIVFTFMGAIAVIVVIIAGISYILSAGDPQKTAKAKDTIVYALIGLAVAILANTIVLFVVRRIFA